MLLMYLTQIPLLNLLAELPARGGYFGTAKIILFLLAAVLWAQNAAWTQADVKKVREIGRASCRERV
jgi:hypothetical protein